jgi:glycosyltransferase involved in cell wall biosynthesis
MSLRQVVAAPGRGFFGGLVRARTCMWRASSRLFVVGDGGGWSVDEDAANISTTAKRLGIDVAPARWARFATRQTAFHTSQFKAVLPHWLESSHRLGLAYLHGRPGTSGAPEFDRCFDALRAAPDRFDRIQVTHAEMHELVLSAGVEPSRVHRIPIGIDLGRFGFGDLGARKEARSALGLAADAFVVGSFQKDGVGWGEGLEPKLIKGPDVLVAALERLAASAPELVVLLTGPARGYVRRELERRGVVYRHVIASTPAELERAYHALDLYLVTSRQEGGPKAVLESMATGVPLVTTRVGQAQELVDDGRNALLAAVDDVDGIAGLAARVYEDAGLRESLRAAGRETAKAFSFEHLEDRWAALFRGFVSAENPPA